MTVADYSDLLILSGEYAGRDDYGYMFPRFVAFTESKLNRMLRVRGMETETTLTTDSNGDATLPTDYLEMRRVIDSTGRVMELSTPLVAEDNYGPYSGTPITYTVSGTTFATVPYAVGTFTIIYYAKITALTASSTTNWLLSDAPLIYLYGVASEIIGWALATGRETDAAKLQAMNAMFMSEVESYQVLDERRRYSNARVRSRGVIV